jgi:tetratricopeptide (TPR) repeat protein
LGLTIRVGQADAFSRIEFRWGGGVPMFARRDGQKLLVAFPRDANPDLSTLKVAPLKWLKGVAARHDRGALVLELTLADDADAATGEADGADFVNIFAKKPAATPSAQTAVPVQPSRPDPTPAGGTLVMRSALAGSQLRFDFPWTNPCGAAVFKRGDAIWVVFDAAARIDVSAAPKNVAQFASIQTFAGPGYTVVRILTREPEAFIATADGSDWAVTLQPFNTPPMTPVKLARDDDAGPPSLKATLAGASGVWWIDDPAVGDKLAVVTALGPVKGSLQRRDFVQFSLLPSAQGLAVEPHTDDLAVAYDNDVATLSRKGGLALSPPGAGSKLAAAAALDAPKPAAMAGMFGDDWSELGGVSFLARYDALLSPIADEEAKGPEGPTNAHLAAARFLIGEQLSYEAIGLLNDALRTHPALGGQAEFRALRGMGRAMAGRYKEAETDLAAPQLGDDPAASLWRGYVDAKTSQWADAKREFTAGSSALPQFPALWKARFARAAAETALALGDTAGGRSWIGYALAGHVDAVEDAQSRLVAAKVAEQQGDATGALAQYRALQASPADFIAGPALMHATEIQLAQGRITPTQAVGTYESLRFRWRGGAFELEDIRTLGQLYLSQGRYREALETLRSAGQSLPDLPEAVQLQADLAAAFKSLFLDGQADGLQPIQALALFYDFKELTPVGEEGDEMVRKLTRRLVDVDLLPQAEQLLKYQVDNRLDGVSKAQVAADLAVLCLMDQKPEDALDAINASRTTVLPNGLNLQRRVLTARALTGLGRYDDALEVLGSDSSADAEDARSEIVWKQRTWPAAGALFEKLLGERYKTAGPLSAEDEGKLLRAAVAFSLAGDDAALARLRDRWQGFVGGSHDPDALRVALSGISDGRVSPADFSRLAADNETFVGWVAKMKQRFDQTPLPAPRAPLQPVKQAAAGTAGQG